MSKSDKFMEPLSRDENGKNELWAKKTEMEMQFVVSVVYPMKMLLENGYGG